MNTNENPNTNPIYNNPNNQPPSLKMPRGRKSSIVLDNTSIQTEVPTFHYNPSDECMCRIAEFSSIHREAKNKEFKNAWNLWTQQPEIAALLNAESARLAESGYQGEIQEKLYFSARYYYRKKSLSTKTPLTQKKERKPHEATDANILEQMNLYILDQIQINNVIRPAEAYENYKQVYTVENEEKTKKIFKNRVFMIRKKMASSP